MIYLIIACIGLLYVYGMILILKPKDKKSQSTTNTKKPLYDDMVNDIIYEYCTKVKKPTPIVLDVWFKVRDIVELKDTSLPSKDYRMMVQKLKVEYDGIMSKLDDLSYNHTRREAYMVEYQMLTIPFHGSLCLTPSETLKHNHY